MDLTSVKDAATDFISNNTVPIAVGAGAAVVGGGIVALALSGRSSKKKTRKGRARDRKFISREKSEQAYQRRMRRKGKKTTGKYYRTKRRRNTRTTKSRRGIHYTKNGQPYKILANGRARFVKKSKGRAR